MAGPNGGFEVRALLGSGYYADVYLATELATRQEVALKAYSDFPPKREAWTRETAALAALTHPRIPRLHAAFEESGWLFVAMDLVGGAGLREHVERHGPLTTSAAVRVGVEVAEALAYTAALGWTYRDLHPRNVHVGTPDGAMLLDFDGARPPGWPPRPSGRVGYRAPELEGSEAVTSACDVFSLAGCLYFALTGSDPPGAPGQLPVTFDHFPVPRLWRILEDSRRARPESRPSAAEVRDELAALHEDDPSP